MDISSHGNRTLPGYKEITSANLCIYMYNIQTFNSISLKFSALEKYVNFENSLFFRRSHTSNFISSTWIVASRFVENHKFPRAMCEAWCNFLSVILSLGCFCTLCRVMAMRHLTIHSAWEVD